jgi:hypothetical protein
MKLKVGQTYRLLSGEVVTVVSLPGKDGWLRAFSHDVGSERTYGAYAFEQSGVELVEVRNNLTLAPLRSLLKEIVHEILAEGKKRAKPKRRR